MNPREITSTTPRDGVWTANGLSSDFRHVYSHPKSPGWHRIQTASGEHYAHESELKWDSAPGGQVVNPDTKAKLREEFVHKAYKAANKTYHLFLLFDAGHLGFCMLEWIGLYWRARWFDEARQLSPSRRERLGEKVPRITRPARFADQDGGRS